MESKRVLIVYGTRYGSTEEIATEIGSIINKEGFLTDIINLDKVPRESWPSISHYNGIIVGSSIKASFWKKNPQKFLSINKDQFNSLKVPLGVFVSSAFSLRDYLKSKNMYIEKILTQLGIEANLKDIFGPVMDFSKDSKVSALERKILKLIAKNITKKVNIKIENSTKNDLRNWSQIRQFAKRFSEII